jgi:hypothetical protein
MDGIIVLKDKIARRRTAAKRISRRCKPESCVGCPAGTAAGPEICRGIRPRDRDLGFSKNSHEFGGIGLEDQRLVVCCADKIGGLVPASSGKNRNVQA